MDIPVYPIIVTVVEECRLVFKKTEVTQSRDWFMFEYPKTGIGLLICLYIFIANSSSSPNSKKRREPRIKRAIITYNAVLFFCHFFTLCGCISLWIRVVSWACEYEDLFSLRISSTPDAVISVTEDLHVFSALKILELVDTIIAVKLEKKVSNRLVSFYQCTLLILISWICCNCFLNSYIALLFISINSCVHCAKYVYYESSIVFQLSGMWTQQLFKKFMKLVSLVQYVILSLYTGYLLAFQDDILEPTQTLILANAFILIYLLVKH